MRHWGRLRDGELVRDGIWYMEGRRRCIAVPVGPFKFVIVGDDAALIITLEWRWPWPVTIEFRQDLERVRKQWVEMYCYAHPKGWRPAPIPNLLPSLWVGPGQPPWWVQDP